MNSQSKQKDGTSGKNPLLFPTVIECLLEFLPLEEIKKCRLICRSWNSVAQPILRKRTQLKILLSPEFGPSNFLGYFPSKPLQSIHPFTTFKFSNYWDSEELNISELEDFITKWSTEIESLEFWHICGEFNRSFFSALQEECQLKEVHLEDSSMDFSLLPKTIEKLTIIKNRHWGAPVGTIALSNLKYLKIHSKDFVLSGLTFSQKNPFENCLNLVDMELVGERSEDPHSIRHNRIHVDFNFFPRSLKRLKLPSPFRFGFCGDENLVKLDVLILGASCYEYTQPLLTLMKPKMLVMTVIRRATMHDVNLLVRENKQMEKIVAAIPLTLLNAQLDRMDLLNLHSGFRYYEFKKEICTRITKKKFDNYAIIN